MGAELKVSIKSRPLMLAHVKALLEFTRAHLIGSLHHDGELDGARVTRVNAAGN